MSHDLFGVLNSKPFILVGHSVQILAGAISTILKILNMTVIVCHLSGPFSVVFPKKKTINLVTCRILPDLIGLTISRSSRMVRMPVQQRWKVKPNPGRIITVFRILCKLGLIHALTCLSHSCRGTMAWAQEWCRTGQVLINHSGSLQEPLLGLDFWMFGVKHHRKLGVCVTALLSPRRFCPRHWHSSCTAVVVWTWYRSWGLQQKDWIQLRTGTIRGVGTNAEEAQLPKQVWPNLVRRSSASSKCKLAPKHVHVVLDHAKNND